MHCLHRDASRLKCRSIRCQSDTATAHFRRVRVRGAYDYPNEIVLTLRGRNGSPGVNILTPIRRAGNDTAVLVNRGWVYSPDGVTVETKQWREGDSVDANGFVEVFPTKGPFDSPIKRVRDR